MILFASFLIVKTRRFYMERCYDFSKKGKTVTSTSTSLFFLLFQIYENLWSPLLLGWVMLHAVKGKESR